MFEYKVVPAPARGQKARGVKGAEARFAYAVEQVMNDLAAEGWEYQRTDVLPSEERQGLTGSVTHWRNLMVFRRALAGAETVAADVPPAPPVRVEPVRTEPARVEPVLTAAPRVTSAVPEGSGVAELAVPVEAPVAYEEGAEETRPA